MAGSPANYRKLVEQRVTHGVPEEFISQLKNQIALGRETFVAQMRGLCDFDRESAGRAILRRHCGWNDVVSAIESVRGITWKEFAGVRGDWGRAAAYYFARKYAGMTLAEIGTSAGGVDYAAVSAMEKRFEKRLSTDKQLDPYVTKVERILNIET